MFFYLTNEYNKTLNDFALLLHKLLRSDRDTNIAFSGFTGEGKSTILIQIFKEYCKLNNIKWTFDFLTWSRKELLKWIDGKKNKAGINEGQLPEYYPIALDELWLLFYKRNWYQEGQIDSLATLNYCRDRHLLIGGNVPNFWDLDGAFTSRIRFYIYVPERGKAWVFEQENNPFSQDAWNKTLNKKLFRKSGTPYGLPNFLMELKFDDLTPKEKTEYLAIRNKKRVLAIDDSKDEKKERYSDIKKQRNILIKLLLELNQDIIKDKEVSKKLGIEKLSYKDLADLLSLSPSLIKMVMIGLR